MANSSLFSLRYHSKRWVVLTRRISGWHVGIFRNKPFVIFDLGRLRIEVAKDSPRKPAQFGSTTYSSFHPWESATVGSGAGSAPGLCRAFGHEWEYDAEESAGPWTGYIERCSRCEALQQVPQ